MPSKNMLLDHPLINPIDHFDTVWDAIKHCDERGMYVYDNKDKQFIYTSFSNIYRRAGILAGVLKEYGISVHDRVILSANTSLDFLSLWTALIRLGAVIIPMPPKSALIGDYKFYNRINRILPYAKHYLCESNEVEDITNALDSQTHVMNVIPLPEVYKKESKSVRVPDRYVPTKDDIAFIQFTSGSTSYPKGIIITYENLFAAIRGIWSQLEVNPATLRAASWLPLYHDMGLVGYFLGCLLTQTELMLLSPLMFAKRPLSFLSLLSDYGIEICSMPNFALEWILRRADRNKEYDFDLSLLKWLGVGAEPVCISTLNDFEQFLRPYGLKRGVISPCYGLAEATLGVTIASPYDPYKIVNLHNQMLPTNGKTLSTVEFKIDHYDTKDFGMIKIKGPSVAKQALIDGQTVSLLDDEGFFNTKDIGFSVNDEYLVIMGRTDEMFIINGENYFPYEIESIVRNSSYSLRKRVVCFDIPATDQSCSPLNIIILYESKPLPPGKQLTVENDLKHMIKRNTGLDVTRIIPVAPHTVPVTPSGKIKRKQAKKMYLDGQFFT